MIDLNTYTEAHKKYAFGEKYSEKFCSYFDMLISSIRLLKSHSSAEVLNERSKTERPSIDKFLLFFI